MQFCLTRYRGNRSIPANIQPHAVIKSDAVFINMKNDNFNRTKFVSIRSSFYICLNVFTFAIYVEFMMTFLRIFYHNRLLKIMFIIVTFLSAYLLVNNYIELSNYSKRFLQLSWKISSFSIAEQPLLLKNITVRGRKFEIQAEQKISNNIETSKSSKTNQSLRGMKQRTIKSRLWNKAKGDEITDDVTENRTATIFARSFVQNNSTKRNASVLQTDKNMRRFKESIEQESEKMWSNKKNVLTEIPNSKRIYVHASVSASISSSGMQLPSRHDVGKILFNKTTEGRKLKQNWSGLNSHLWVSLCVESVNLLCNHPSFPLFPDKRQRIRGKLHLVRKEQGHAQRIFGFLHPPRSGEYRYETELTE